MKDKSLSIIHFSQEFYVTTYSNYYIIFFIFGPLPSRITSFLSFPKIYFSSPFPSILLIFTLLSFSILYPTNHYISGFYSYISGIFGFLDFWILFHYHLYFWSLIIYYFSVFLEPTSWNSWMLILDFKNFRNAFQDYQTYIITH